MAAPRLHYTGVLEVTRVHFYAIVRGLFHAGKSLLFGVELMMSDVTNMGHEMTTSARSWGGKSRRSEWPQSVTEGAGMFLYRRVLPEWGDHIYLACVYLAGISWSPASARVTAP